MPLGAILNDLDNKNFLNSREGELYTFPSMHRSESERRNLTMTTTCPRADGAGCTYRLEARRAQMQTYYTPTLEYCLEVVEASDGLQEWFKATDYDRSAYLVIGRKMVPLPTADDNNDSPVGRLDSYEWEDYENPSATATIVDGKVFAVQLMKIGCKRQLLVGPRKLVCESCPPGDREVI